jgi:gas vesicle protein
MTEKNGFTGGQMLLAFLGGAAAGAAVALLTAPRSGAETRQLIGSTATSGKEAAKRIPEASHSAAEAAKEAFVQTMNT